VRAMVAPDSPSDVPDPAEDGLVEVGTYASEAEAAEHGLVVLAAGRAYWLAEIQWGHVRLLVERDAVAELRWQLAAYDRERVGWPPAPIVDPWTPRRTEFLTPLLWAVIVLGLFRLGEDFPDWVSRGVLDSQAVFANGEVWRAATALFLHADAAHVISNALNGLLIFPPVLSTLGRMKGWLLLLIASVTANLAVAAIHFPGAYRSLGSSTAIFAGVGLLVGRGISVAWRSHHPQRWRAIFASLAVGVAVLGLYGAGGQRVDVGAHLAGFLAGLVLWNVWVLGRGGLIRETESKA